MLFRPLHLRSRFRYHNPRKYDTQQFSTWGEFFDVQTRTLDMHIRFGNLGPAPPARGFRPLTVCDGEYFFAKNPLNRYTLGPRNALKYNEDGSLDLHLQKDSPGKERESNWPPAPSGKFILMLRPYGPQETPPSVINGTWQPPAVKAVK
jgi:hypothetical protein